MSYSPTTGTTSTTSPLVGVRLTDRCDLQSVHTNFRIVDLELGVARINDEEDTIDYTRMSDKFAETSRNNLTS